MKLFGSIKEEVFSLYLEGGLYLIMSLHIYGLTPILIKLAYKLKITGNTLNFTILYYTIIAKCTPMHDFIFFSFSLMW